MRELSVVRKSDNAIFSIAKNGDKWEILRHEPWYKTDAYYANSFFDKVAPFDSRIKAYAFLKKNINEFL